MSCWAQRSPASGVVRKASRPARESISDCMRHRAQPVPDGIRQAERGGGREALRARRVAPPW